MNVSITIVFLALLYQPISPTPAAIDDQHTSAIFVKKESNVWTFQGDVWKVAQHVGPTEADPSGNVLGNFPERESLNKRVLYSLYKYMVRYMASVDASNVDKGSLAISVADHPGPPKEMNEQKQLWKAEPFPAEIASTEKPIGQTEKIIGPIGVDTNIENHCLFYTDFTYSCKTDCVSSDDSEPIIEEFTGRSDMKYFLYNCSLVLQNNRVQWNQSDGIIDKVFNSPMTREIIATCAFYRTSWYECFDVADCSRGQDKCRGGTPWRGFYYGTPEIGYKGNISAVAMNNGMPKADQASALLVTTSTAQRIPNFFCQIEIKDSVVVYYQCYRLQNKCNHQDVDHQTRDPYSDFCRVSLEFLSRNAWNEPVFQRIEEVISTIKEEPQRAISFLCNQFDTTEFCCQFPHSASWNIDDIRSKYGGRCQ